MRRWRVRCEVDKSYMLPNANNAECECKVELHALGVTLRLGVRVSAAERGVRSRALHSELCVHDDYAGEVA